MKIKQEDKTFTIVDPVTKMQLEVERVILKTNKPTDAYFSYGDVSWKEDENGNEYLDFTGLDDFTKEKDFPADMEVILLNCNMNAEYLPVKFNHEIGNYSEVWIKQEDLDLVSGNLGTKTITK